MKKYRLSNNGDSIEHKQRFATTNDLEALKILIKAKYKEALEVLQERKEKKR